MQILNKKQDQEVSIDEKKHLFDYISKGQFKSGWSQNIQVDERTLQHYGDKIDPNPIQKIIR